MAPNERGREFKLPELFAGTEAFMHQPDDRIRIEERTWDHELWVHAEIPGVDVERDVDISVHDGRLYIEVERRPEHVTEDPSGFQSEFRYGRFSRVRTLPPGTVTDDIVATCADGILEIKIPYRHGPDVRKIPITAA
jgi:HSP20 family protein